MRKRMKHNIFLGLVSLAVVALGVLSFGSASAIEQEEDTSQYGEIVDGIVAVVGDQVVTRSELSEAMAFEASLLKAKVRAGLDQDAMNSQFLELQKEIRGNLVDNKLILLAAIDEDLDVDEQLDKRVSQLKQAFPAEDALNRGLAAQGYGSLKEFRSKMREELLRQRIVFTQVRPRSEVTQKEVNSSFKKRYGGKKAREANCAGALVRVFALEQVRFQLPKDIRFSQLIESYSNAYSCYLNLKAGKFQFSDAVTECTLNNVAPAIGSLGEVDETKSFEANFQGAFDTIIAADGIEYSEPFIINDGIWLLRVKSTRTECMSDSSAVARLKERLKARLGEEKFERVMKWWLRQLRGKFRVVLRPLNF